MMRPAPLTLACLLALPAGAADVQLGFRQPVYRGAWPAKAGELLHVRSADRSLAERVRQIELAVRAGTPALTQQEVLRQLRQAEPATDIAWAWRGAGALQLAAEPNRIAVADVVGTAQEALRAELQKAHQHIELRPLGQLSEVPMAAGGYRLKARLPEPLRLRARMAVPVDIYVDGQPARSVSVWFAVSAYRDVPVAARDLAPTEALDASAFTLEARDVAQAGGTAMTDLSGLADHWLPNGLKAGEPLRREDLQLRPWVLRDQRVRVRVQHGGVVLEAMGTAEQTGNRNDVIRVRADGAEAPCQGRVTAKGVVDVVS